MPQFENLTFAARGCLSSRENIGEAPKIRADVHLSFKSITVAYVWGSCVLLTQRHSFNESGESQLSLRPSPSLQPISLLSQISLDPSVHHVLSLLQACGALR